MLRKSVLLGIALFALVEAIPFKDKDKFGKFGKGWESGESGWGGGGWGGGNGWNEEQRPAYDINPHFGFRQYSEMRYEPPVVPYAYNTGLTGPPAAPQPLAPMFNQQGPPYAPNLPPGSPVKYGGHMSASYQPQQYNSYDDGYLTK